MPAFARVHAGSIRYCMLSSSNTLKRDDKCLKGHNYWGEYRDDSPGSSIGQVLALEDGHLVVMYVTQDGDGVTFDNVQLTEAALRRVETDYYTKEIIRSTIPVAGNDVGSPVVVAGLKDLSSKFPRKTEAATTAASSASTY